MKKYVILITFILSGLFANSQTDIEIAKALIGKPVSGLEEQLKELELEYYITTDVMGVLHLFIVKENSVRHWEIIHSNINDLREFYEYEVPKSTKFHRYEKEAGSNVSHLKITQL